MKKIYMAPEMSIENLEAVNMIALSKQTGSATGGKVYAPKAVLDFDAFDDIEEE